MVVQGTSGYQLWKVDIFYNTSVSSTAASLTSVGGFYFTTLSMSSDRDIVVTAQWQSASASLIVEGLGFNVYGPYYGA